MLCSVKSFTNHNISRNKNVTKPTRKLARQSSHYKIVRFELKELKTKDDVEQQKVEREIEKKSPFKFKSHYFTATPEKTPAAWCDDASWLLAYLLASCLYLYYMKSNDEIEWSLFTFQSRTKLFNMCSFFFQRWLIFI